VRNGDQITVPAGGEFVLRAAKPDKNLIIVLITEKKSTLTTKVMAIPKRCLN
jgi:hypothetical protein